VKVYWDFPHVAPVGAAFPALAVGVFDGVHRGHQRILERLLEIAAGRPAAVVTFDPHPRAVLGLPKLHRLLSPIAERLELLRAWPLGATVVLRFDAEVARRTYVEFVRDALVGLLGARDLVIGADTHLGRDRAGTPERLVELGEEIGYRVHHVAPVRVDGEVASSTTIRHRLDAGDVEGAARFLGRPYWIRGEVVRGAGRGRGLGIPTANLEVPESKLVPANGVYAARVVVGGVDAAAGRDTAGGHGAAEAREMGRGRDTAAGHDSGAGREAAVEPGLRQEWPGAVNIGLAPTFGGAGQRGVEVHLVGFEGDLYGRTLDLRLVRRLRDEQRFETPAALVAQVRADIEATRRVVAASEITRKNA
jgi:riboflavin kinase/FMN adenylyltransferase